MATAMKMMNSSPAPTRNFNSSTSEFLPLICAWLIYPLSHQGIFVCILPGWFRNGTHE
jgi:hypothetical protein